MKEDLYHAPSVGCLDMLQFFSLSARRKRYRMMIGSKLRKVWRPKSQKGLDPGGISALIKRESLGKGNRGTN